MRIGWHLTKLWQFASTQSTAICSVKRRQRDIVSHSMTAATTQTAAQFASIPVKERTKQPEDNNHRAALSFTGLSQGAGWSLWLMKTCPQLLSAIKRLTNMPPDPVGHKQKDAKPATNIEKKRKSRHPNTLFYEVWINTLLTQSAVNPSFYNFPLFMNNTNSLIGGSLTNTLDYCLSLFYWGQSNLSALIP